MPGPSGMTFNGRCFAKDEIIQISEIVVTCSSLSRTELASTICELFSWKRPSGKLKTVECRQLLEYLDHKGTIRLPHRRSRRAVETKPIISHSPNAQSVISTSLSELYPVYLSPIQTKEQRQRFYEYVEQYHYLGYQQPFGAQLRYFIVAGKGKTQLLGCLQFSSPAWKIAPRDRWITWDNTQRKRNLQKIVSNSRFLLLPWVKVKNLASHVLALAAKVVPAHWAACYGYRPYLFETFVDSTRFKGTCYQAANWIHVGTTTGRGRMDRKNQRQGISPKEIYLYPLTVRFRQKLLSL
jgi:hypothetical protein